MNSNVPIIIEQGAMALDGGSIWLQGKDEKGRRLSILLDWSIASQQNGTTSLTVNGITIEKGSYEEKNFLERLKRPGIGSLLENRGEFKLDEAMLLLEEPFKETKALIIFDDVQKADDRILEFFNAMLGSL